MKKNNFPLNLIQGSIFNFQLIIAFLFALAQYQVQAQTEKEKALLEMEQKVASGELSDEEMFKHYQVLIWDYHTRDMEKTNLYFKKAIAFAQKKNNVEWEANYLQRMGTIYHDLGIKDTAFIFLDNALKLIEGKGLYKEESSNYKTRGECYKNQNNPKEALNAFLKALELNEKDKAQNIAGKQDISQNLKNEVQMFNNIAGIYYGLLNYDKAIEYALKSKKIIDDNPGVDFARLEHTLLGNLSGIYMEIGEYEKAFPLLEKSYQLAVEREELPSMVFAMQRLSDYYRIYKKEYNKALNYAKEALPIAEKTKQPYLINVAERNLMGAYIGVNDFKKALYYAESVLSRTDEDDWDELEDVYGELIRIYALLGDKENSEEYLVKFRDLFREISDENMHNALQEMEVKYDVQQKELELIRKQAEIDRQTAFRNLSFMGLAIALLIVGLMVYIVLQRNRRNRELAEMNSIKDKFFSIISHDLKNPAVAQRDALQLLTEHADKWDPNRLSVYYQQLLKSASGLVDLLQNLLNWAQIQTGKENYRPFLFDLVLTLKPDLELIENIAERKAITLETHLPPTAIITGDENMLPTVVRNLLSNAVKFTATGGRVVLEIKEIKGYADKEIKEIKGYADKEIKGIKEYIVSVSDDGVGMTPEQIDNLFRIDRQQSHLGTAGEKGTGLGLIVCKEMIEKHGSTLHVESEIGKGSKFWFEI